MKIPRPRPPSSRRVERNGSPSQSSTSGGESGTVVLDRQYQPGPCRAQRHQHLARGELNRVVDQIGQRMPEFRGQRHFRLGRAVRERQLNANIDVRARVLAGDVLQQAGERRAGEGPVATVVGLLAQAGQQLAAALGLGQQLAGLVHQWVAVRQLAHQLLGDHVDRRQGRAEKVGDRGGLAAQRRKLLFAGQCELGGGQGLGRAAAPPRPRSMRTPRSAWWPSSGRPSRPPGTAPAGSGRRRARAGARRRGPGLPRRSAPRPSRQPSNGCPG